MSLGQGIVTFVFVVLSLSVVGLFLHIINDKYF